MKHRVDLLNILFIVRHELIMFTVCNVNMEKYIYLQDVSDELPYFPQTQYEAVVPENIEASLFLVNHHPLYIFW